MPNTRYSPETVSLLRGLYPFFSNAQLAEVLGIGSAHKVKELARRNAIKWRAENGAPQWRDFSLRFRDNSPGRVE